jgi:hypothetical protein
MRKENIMKMFSSLLLKCALLGTIVLQASLLSVRAAEPAKGEKTAAPERAAVAKPDQKTAAKAQRIAMEKAQTLVGSYIMSTTPAMSPFHFTLKELGDDEVWNRLSAQIFQVTNEFRQYETYLIKDGKVYPLGEAFGGWGVMSFCVANVRDVGIPYSPKLIYSYSFGSGLHRSHVAFWWEQDGAPQEVKVPFAYRGDMFVKAIVDTRTEAIREHIMIEVGDYQQKINKWTTKATLGELFLTKKDDKTTVDVDFSGKLPEDIKKDLYNLDMVTPFRPTETGEREGMMSGMIGNREK